MLPAGDPGSEDTDHETGGCPRQPRTQDHCSEQRRRSLITSASLLNQKQACQWVAAFVNCDNHRNRKSGITYVRPVQRHSISAIAICKQGEEVYGERPQGESNALEPKYYPQLA